MAHSDYLSIAGYIADCYSGDRDTKIGAVIVKEGKKISFGANRTFEGLECDTIPAAIDALCGCLTDKLGAIMYLTHPPCKESVKAIMASGIRKLIYGTSLIDPYLQYALDQSSVETVYMEVV